MNKISKMSKTKKKKINTKCSTNKNKAQVK